MQNIRIYTVDIPDFDSKRMQWNNNLLPANEVVIQPVANPISRASYYLPNDIGPLRRVVNVQPAAAEAVLARPANPENFDELFNQFRMFDQLNENDYNFAENVGPKQPLLGPIVQQRAQLFDNLQRGNGGGGGQEEGGQAPEGAADNVI